MFAVDNSLNIHCKIFAIFAVELHLKPYLFTDEYSPILTLCHVVIVDVKHVSFVQCIGRRNKSDLSPQRIFTNESRVKLTRFVCFQFGIAIALLSKQRRIPPGFVI